MTTKSAMTELLPATARQRAKRAIRALIDSGQIRPGHPIPAERALAKQLNVARQTLRQAFADLREEGILTDKLGRTRRLAHGDPQDHFMARTIAVLSAAQGTAEEVSQAMPGRDIIILLEVIQRLQSASMNALTTDPATLAPLALERLLSHRPAGLLCPWSTLAESPVGQHILSKARQHRIPAVVYTSSPALENFDRVTSDHAAGSYALTKWLIAQGRRRIVRFWRFEENWGWLQARDQGHEQAMREAALNILPAIRMPTFPFKAEFPPACNAETYHDMCRAIAGYLIQPFSPPDAPDAILVATDRHAYQVATALRLLGKIPGRDVLIAGYDNTYKQDVDRAFEPCGPAATVDKQNSKLAREMVSLLLERVSGKLAAGPQLKLLPPELILPAANTGQDESQKRIGEIP